MKRFIFSILCVTVSAIGLGALVEKATATLKSDERAVALIKQARLAIGGEQSIAEVRSMIIKGDTSININMDGVSRNEKGETEIALQLPDKLSKMVKINHEGVAEGEKITSKAHEVIVMKRSESGAGIGGGTGIGIGVEPGAKKVIVRTAEGDGPEVEKIIVEGKEGEFTTRDGKKVVIRKDGDVRVDEKVLVHSREKGERIRVEKAEYEAVRQNELLRTTLSLLLTPPVGMDVNYTYGGEVDVDGTTCDLVNAEFAGSNIKLFLSKASSLPVMVSYQGNAMPTVMRFRAKAPEGAEPVKENVVFARKVEAPEMAEVQVRFSDYRGVNGVQLPYKWTTTVGGQTAEVFDVSSYEINPANIAEKFQDRKVFMRTKKEAN